MKIMTLNVNGFRGLAGYEDVVANDICSDYMRQIKILIDELLDNKNDIIILQEIPHKIKEEGRWHWGVNSLYDEFNEMFQEYKILRPKHLIISWQCTVAICKKDSSWEQLNKGVLQYDKKYTYGNKFVELQCGDFTLLGVHVATTQDIWEKLLLPTFKDAPYTCVIGDFNANVKKGPMSDKPKKIRDCGYENLIPYNKITYYPREKSIRTSVDNIYINSSFTMDKNAAVKVEETNLTDHALCILEYDFEYIS